MKRTKLTRVAALFLTLLMVSGTFVVMAPVSAAGEDGTGSLLQEMSEALNAKSYLEYRSEYEGVPRATSSVTVDAADYVKDETTAEVEVKSDYEGMEGDSLYVPDTGVVSWRVDIPATGLYAIKIDYNPITYKANNIERALYVNDKIPFAEAGHLAMTKVWVNEYLTGEDGGPAFEADQNGNELRPNTVDAPEWCVYNVTDSNGYYLEPFEFYFEAGENTLTLEGAREPIVIRKITLYPYESIPSYADVKSTYSSKGYKDASAEPVEIQAEYPSKMSHNTIYPLNDRTSAITYPQDPVKVRLNSIGGDKWERVGQWIEYEIDVPASGLYTIAVRFKQSDLNGLFVSRRLYIDGEVPFEECNSLRFGYATKWQSKRLGQDEEGDEPYKFYLEAGKHTIRLEVTLGDLGPVISSVSDTLEVINDAYLSILKLTGANPDQYRDYGFYRTIPGTIRALVNEGKNLEKAIEDLENMNGVAGENTSTLSQIQRLVEKMGSDEDEVAANLNLLKSYIGTLGTWINTVSMQPLDIDIISIQPESESLPKADANFFQSIWFEIRSFVGSFYTDYNSLGSTSDTEDKGMAEVWVVTGRDQANIIRNLIDNRFTPNTGVSINLKLVAGGTLLPSILAGVGPDVSLFTGDGDVINYAIRGALQGMNDMLCKNCKSKGRETLKYVGDGDYKCEVCGADGEGNWELYFDTFDEVTSRFSKAATIPLTLYGETFAIPETQTFPMLFYRKDILADLGLEVPQTWDDVLALVPVLQYNKMEVGLTADYLTYLYQMGGQLYADDGMRINLDSNLSLSAFEMMCNMFTKYSLPYTYDPANRFRTGEIPVMIQPYTLYNQLVLFATEISGLWEFTVIPGMEQADGSINHTAVSTVGGVVMMEGSDHKKLGWQFIDWYTDADFQADYSNELVAVLGEGGMNPTANIEALAELSWSTSEYNKLNAQFQSLTAVPNYPGSYIIARYTDFAFKAAYNDKKDPTDSLLGYINTINKEISRKREEFDLETLDIGQTLAEKRSSQAIEILDDLRSADKDKYAAEIAKVQPAVDAALMSDATQAEYDALLGIAAGLRSTNSELFGLAAKYLEEAVAAQQSYVK